MGAAGSKRFKEVGNDDVVSFVEEDSGVKDEKLVRSEIRKKNTDGHTSGAGGVEKRAFAESKNDISVSDLSVSDFVDDKASHRHESVNELLNKSDKNLSAGKEEVDISSNGNIYYRNGGDTRTGVEKQNSSRMVCDTHESGHVSLLPKHSPILSPKECPNLDDPSDFSEVFQLSQKGNYSDESGSQFPNKSDCEATDGHDRVINTSHSKAKSKSNTPNRYDSRSDVSNPVPDKLPQKDLQLSVPTLSLSPSMIHHSSTQATAAADKQLSISTKFAPNLQGQACEVLSILSPNLTQRTSGVATPDRSFMSPVISDTDEDSFSLAGYGSIMQKVRLENQSLLDLQRQRTMSTMQNAKVCYDLCSRTVWV
jgi:hypothetical protein